MHNKTQVGVIYGGESFEHEVSKMTAKSILENIDRSLFDVKKIYISKRGKFNNNELDDIDVAFLAVHGPSCEDGKLQSLLEKRGIKYTGSKVKASQLNMDKSLMHKTFLDNGLPTVKFLSFNKKDIHKIQNKVLKNIGLPIYIKPNNGGSSIGMSKVETIDQLDRSLKKAFQHDSIVIVEKAVESPREIEIGILGNKELVITDPGEILTDGQFYSYETKYIQPFKSTSNVKNLSGKQVNEFKQLAQKAYKCTGCEGYARADFLMDNNQNIYVNEINTLPGFTKISMFPKLFKKKGIKYRDLITKIIQLAL